MNFSLFLLSAFVVVFGCAKNSGDESRQSPQTPAHVSENQSPGKTVPPMIEPPSPDSKPVKLGTQVNVEVTPEQPMFGLRYSKSQTSQFDFNFKVKASEVIGTEPHYLGHAYTRLVSKSRMRPLTVWYFQGSARTEKIDAGQSLFFFQPLFAKQEATAAAQDLKDLAIQISVRADQGADLGEWYWIDLGGFCATTPQNFMETDSITTGCN